MDTSPKKPPCHLILDTWSGFGLSENHSWRFALDPRRVMPDDQYLTVCEKRLYGIEASYSCSYELEEATCEDCLDVIALATLAELP